MLDLTTNKRFEVSVQRGGRWVIDCLARSEQEAQTRAEELYNDEANEAVRIVRGRFSRDGNSFETVIHERKREARRGEAPVRVAASPSEEAWCETFDELYGPASRRAIARLMRNFLDKYAITPTELLHHHRYIRLLDRQENLLSQAVQRMAGLQARARGVDVKLRLDALNHMVEQATSRARDAVASRGAPKMGAGGIVELLDTVAAKTSTPSDQAFLTRYALCLAFEAVPDPAEKLAATLDWTDKAGERFVPLLDELVSGLFGSVALIQDVLGGQASLAAALGTLIELSTGHAAEKATPLLTRIAAMIAKHTLPETRLVLLDRVIAGIGGETALSREDSQGQRRLYDGLVEKLTDDHGMFVGGTRMVEAFARRSRKLAIVGGIDTPRFKTETPVERIEEIMIIAAGVVGERQQRALATHLAELIETWRGTAAERAILAERVAGMKLPETVRTTLAGRLQRPAA